MRQGTFLKQTEFPCKNVIVTFVSEQYSPFCMQKRNQYMIDKSDCVLAFWNQDILQGGTVNTIRYAKSKNKHIEFFILNNFL